MFEDIFVPTFDNSFKHLNASSNFKLLMGAPTKAVEQKEADSSAAAYAILESLRDDKQLVMDHIRSGCDATLYVADFCYPEKGKQSCRGGLAVQFFKGSAPFAVVDIDCILNGRAHVGVHESGHLFGADHDLETDERDARAIAKGRDRDWRNYMPPPGKTHAFLKCDCSKRIAVYTMMSYGCAIDFPDCKWFFGEQQYPLPVFSSPRIFMSGMTVGLDAATPNSYGADNAQIVYDNWNTIASNGKLFDKIENIKARTAERNDD
eukprot:21361-Heterococcus_DN1.PRE.5